MNHTQFAPLLQALGREGHRAARTAHAFPRTAQHMEDLGATFPSPETFWALGANPLLSSWLDCSCPRLGSLARALPQGPFPHPAAVPGARAAQAQSRHMGGSGLAAQEPSAHSAPRPLAIHTGLCLQSPKMHHTGCHLTPLPGSSPHPMTANKIWDSLVLGFSGESTSPTVPGPSLYPFELLGTESDVVFWVCPGPSPKGSCP